MRFLTFLFWTFAIACTSQHSFTKAGAIKYTVRLYDSSSQQYSREFIFADMNLWYKNELYIEEIKSVETYVDTNGVMTRKTPLAYYLFIDRSSKSFYHYSSFSDTARIIDKYILSDTAMLKGVGGWAFYKNWDIGISGTLNTLGDTLIDNILYKRDQFPIISNGSLVTIIAYQRCDKKGTIFQFDTLLSNKLRCPVTRIDFLPSRENPRPISPEIHFLRDSLTKEELKIFDAWEKNIKKYPVDK